MERGKGNTERKDPNKSPPCVLPLRSAQQKNLPADKAGQRLHRKVQRQKKSPDRKSPGLFCPHLLRDERATSCGRAGLDSCSCYCHVPYVSEVERQAGTGRFL